MRKLNKGIISAIMLIVFATTSNAQPTANGTATTTIVTITSIQKNLDMSFGNIAVGATSGIVILTPAGSRYTAGGVTLSAATGAVTAADFTIIGNEMYSCSITLPSTVILTRAGGSETMTVNKFTSTLSSTAASNAGTLNLKVGATLNVVSQQVAGVYSSDNFDVTLNYN